MNHFNIKATNIELTEELHDYIEKRLSSLEEVIQSFGDTALLEIEIGKTTEHHKLGRVFRVEINFSVGKNLFRVNSLQVDLYKAIDDVKQQFSRKITSYKDKQQTLFKRGALRLKNLLKGLIQWKK